MKIKSRMHVLSTGFKEPPETGYTCPVCGIDVEWWKEPWQLLNGCVCHEECLVDMEDEHGSKETC